MVDFAKELRRASWAAGAASIALGIGGKGSLVSYLVCFAAWLGIQIFAVILHGRAGYDEGERKGAGDGAPNQEPQSGTPPEGAEK